MLERFFLKPQTVDRPADARRRDRNLVRDTVRHFFSLVVSKCDHHPDNAAWANPFAGQVTGLSIFVKSEAFAQALSTTTSTTCAGSSAISISGLQRPRRWHCP